MGSQLVGDFELLAEIQRKIQQPELGSQQPLPRAMVKFDLGDCMVSAVPSGFSRCGMSYTKVPAQYQPRTRMLGRGGVGQSMVRALLVGTRKTEDSNLDLEGKLMALENI